MRLQESQPQRLIVLNQMAGPLTWELVEDLANSGWSIELLTGHPDTLAKGSQPNLNVYRSFRYRRGSMLLRSICWTCYMAHAFLWLWRRPKNTPLLIFSNPPMLAWVAATMRRLRGTHFVVMVHDIYPELPVRMGKLKRDGIVERAWSRWNRWAYNLADEVLTLGEYMSRVVQTQFDVATTTAGKVHVIYPWADTDRIRPMPKEQNPFALKHEQADKLTVMYSGNMGLGHDLETMLAATRHIIDQQAHFLFIGAGPKWSMIDHALRTEQLANVTLLSWLPEEDIPYSLATADIAMVSLESEVAGLAIPSKAFYSLAAGTPLIVISDEDTELARLVQEHQCGWLVSPGDELALARIVNDMLQSPELLAEFKRKARSASELIGARKTNSKRFRELLETVTTDGVAHALST